MSRVVLTALLASLACGAFTLDSSEWPLTPQEAARLEAQHAKACAELSGLLDEGERLQKELKDSPDPDATLKAWAAIQEPMLETLRAIEASNVNFNKGMAATDVLIMLRAVQASNSGERPSADISPEYKAVNARQYDMTVRTKRLLARYYEQSGQRLDADAARKRQLEHQAENRLVLAVSAGVAVCLLVAGFWVSRRRKPAPPSSIIKL